MESILEHGTTKLECLLFVLNESSRCSAKICTVSKNLRNVSYVNSQLRKSFPIKAPEGLIESFLRKFSPLMAVSQVEKKGKIIRM